MSVIGILHPGEMGAAIGETLREAGHHVLWSSAGRSRETIARAKAAGLADAGVPGQLAGRAEILISVCPPHAARDTAEEFPGFHGLYIDANAIAPDSARGLAAVQPRLVDGGIVGQPPTRAGAMRLYLSGADASAAATLFSDTRVDARVVSDRVGDASAVKMAYAAWTKGTAALLLAIRALARAEGVDEALLAEWSLSQPQLAEQSVTAARSAGKKGWRWRGEMEEIAASFGAAGLPEGFHQAAAEIYGHAPRSHDPSTPGNEVGGDDALERAISLLLGRVEGP